MNNVVPEAMGYRVKIPVLLGWEKRQRQENLERLKGQLAWHMQWTTDRPFQTHKRQVLTLHASIDPTEACTHIHGVLYNLSTLEAGEGRCLGAPSKPRLQRKIFSFLLSQLLVPYQSHILGWSHSLIYWYFLNQERIVNFVKYFCLLIWLFLDNNWPQQFMHI